MSRTQADGLGNAALPEGAPDMGDDAIRRDTDYELLPLDDEPGCYLAIFSDGLVVVVRAEEVSAA